MTRVAIAHDYLTQRGGAERVVLALLKAFPGARLHTTLYDPEGTYPEFRDADVVTSPLDRVAGFRHHHRAALPLLPLAARSLHIDADVVVASSSGWAHGFRTTGKTLVYCYSPARWIYQTDAYLGGSPTRSATGLALLGLRPFLRRWDQRHAARVDQYVAISRVVRERIRQTYGRDSLVVPAPHSADPSRPQHPVPELEDWAEAGFHLVVSRLLPYKNVDAAVAAFADLPDERLVVVGRGPERQRLLDLASPNVRLVQDLTDDQVRWTYAHCTTLLAPSHEDFGLTPLEAAAYGKPTLALHAGGYLDTVMEGVSGSFFEAPTPAAVRAAVLDNREQDWDADAVRRRAADFGEPAFIARMQQLVADL